MRFRDLLDVRFGGVRCPFCAAQSLSLLRILVRHGTYIECSACDRDVLLKMNRSENLVMSVAYAISVPLFLIGLLFWPLFPIGVLAAAATLAISYHYAMETIALQVPQTPNNKLQRTRGGSSGEQ